MCYRVKLTLGLVAMVILIGGMPCISHAFSGKLQIPPEGKTQIITLEDGSALFGKITAVGESDIKFKTDMGEITIAINKIKKIVEISSSSIKDGEYWFPNPNRSRLMFGPTARSLNKGEGYFYDVWVFFPGLAYGITDNFMISGGVSIIPEVDNQLFYLIPKVSFNAGKDLDIGISLNAFRLWGKTLFIGLGNLTYGTDDHSVTGGLGMAFNEDNVADQPVWTIGGEYRLSRRVALVGESWFIPTKGNDGLFGIGGFRFFGEKMAVDLGALFIREDKDNEPDPYTGEVEEDETNWLPYIDFVWNF